MRKTYFRNRPLPPCLYLSLSHPSSTPTALSSLTGSAQVPEGFRSQSQMHWQILAIHFEMFFLSIGLNDNQAFLPLVLIPVTHKVCFTEAFQELSLDPRCPSWKDLFGYNWRLSPEGTGILWTNRKSREGHTIDTTLQRRLQENNSNVEIRVLEFQNQQILSTHCKLRLFTLFQHKICILRQSLLTAFYNKGTEAQKGYMTFLRSQTCSRVEI